MDFTAPKFASHYGIWLN